ncbi:MAG: aspartyl-phosphate phosphatase Spo0E family protein [Veillonellaceae bacterium]|jgi:hypothetical protein|nr:aspartyl-phosphate phosphatase Spo0E family protein [Veillonellaceae bacterium]
MLKGAEFLNQIQEIEAIIEKLRTRLHETAKGRCLTDPEVVKASQELNQKLNEYERLLTEKCNSKQGRNK